MVELWRLGSYIYSQVIKTHKRRNIFLFLALLVFLSKLSFVLLNGWPEESIVIPGWHTTIEYKVAFLEWFTVIYFIAIAIIYDQDKNRLSNYIFWTHAVLSIIPLLTYFSWYFTSTGLDHYENVLIEFEFLKNLVMFFLITQAIFILIILGKRT